MELAPNPEPIHILIVEDHALFREGLVRLLSTEPDLIVVGQCAAAAEGLERLPTSGLDLVLLDFQLEDGNALRFLQGAHRSGFRGKILIITAGMSGENSLKALQQGAAGIILKHNSPAALIKAIRLVMGGHVWIDPAVVQTMAAAVPSAEDDAFRTGLNEREHQVLQGVFEGLTNRKIGERIGVSEGTVKATLQSLFHKTGVRNRSQLVRFALERSHRAG